MKHCFGDCQRGYITVFYLKKYVVPTIVSKTNFGFTDCISISIYFNLIMSKDNNHIHIRTYASFITLPKGKISVPHPKK